MQSKQQDVDPGSACPKCGKPLVATISRDVMVGVAVGEVYCEACGLRDCTYLKQLPNDEYEPMGGHPSAKKAAEFASKPPANLSQPAPRNLAEPPGSDL